MYESAEENEINRLIKRLEKKAYREGYADGFATNFIERNPQEKNELQQQIEKWEGNLNDERPAPGSIHEDFVEWHKRIDWSLD